MNTLAVLGGVPASAHYISYGHQSITDEDVLAVAEVLQSDYLTTGPTVGRFEDTLARYTGAKHAVAVSSGTAALHVACLACGIQGGDEVIVSSLTFAASANCVLYCGAKPVFADIDSQTWNISPTEVEKLVTSRTKAIIAVDYAGCPIDHAAIREICNRHGLFFIEDAAHALGTRRLDRMVGNLADITVFSFHPVKTITSGEGGALTTNDSRLAARSRLFACHGITRNADMMTCPKTGGWYYEQVVLGYNYRMSDIHAALGISQIARIDGFVRRRQEITERYNQAFAKIPAVQSQFDEAPWDTARHLYCLRYDLAMLGVERRFLYDAYQAENIGVNVHYLPVYRLPYYSSLGYSRECCPEADKLYESILTLPLHCCLTDDDVAAVIFATEKIIGWCLSK